MVLKDNDEYMLTSIEKCPACNQRSKAAKVIKCVVLSSPILSPPRPDLLNVLSHHSRHPELRPGRRTENYIDIFVLIPLGFTSVTNIVVLRAYKCFDAGLSSGVSN